MKASSLPDHLPLPLKLVLTSFVAVMVPVYWLSYGPTNFLYFCDVALLLTTLGVWLESSLLISMCCVGILLPQLFWLTDFLCRLCGHTLTGMTGYMFNPKLSLFARGLSLFHGWLPVLLIYLVRRLGYDKRALLRWGLLASGLVAVAYLYMPAPGSARPFPGCPINIDYVYGFSDEKPQQWMDPRLYVLAYTAALWLVLFLPTHALLQKFAGRTQASLPT